MTLTTYEKQRLKDIAMKIDKIPMEFSYDGKSVNMAKIQKILREYS